MVTNWVRSSSLACMLRVMSAGGGLPLDSAVTSTPEMVVGGAFGAACRARIRARITNFPKFVRRLAAALEVKTNRDVDHAAGHRSGVGAPEVHPHDGGEGGGGFRE